MIVLKFEMSLAIGDREVGAETLRRNSLTPLLTDSKEKMTSFAVLPGFTNMRVASSSIPLFDLKRFQVLRTDFSS